MASRIIARLGARFRRPGRTRGNVVFGGPRGEHQTVPIAIYSDLLRLGGYDVLELGADVPVEAFVESVRGTDRLICVGISVTRPDALNAARLVIDAVRLVDPEMPIALGGLADTAHRGSPASSGSAGSTVTVATRWTSSPASSPPSGPTRRIEGDGHQRPE